MTEVELLVLIEEQVGRGRWFVPGDVRGWWSETAAALVVKWKLERNMLKRDDERRRRPTFPAVFEYRLPIAS